VVLADHSFCLVDTGAAICRNGQKRLNETSSLLEQLKNDQKVWLPLFAVEAIFTDFNFGLNIDGK
jgi:hypothetical protein